MTCLLHGPVAEDATMRSVDAASEAIVVPGRTAVATMSVPDPSDVPTGTRGVHPGPAVGAAAVAALAVVSTTSKAAATCLRAWDRLRSRVGPDRRRTVTVPT